MNEVRKLKRSVIKEEYVAITGDFVKAVILNQFMYWSERVKDFDEYIEQENKRAEQNGDDVQELTGGWIYKTGEELSNETMLGLSTASIRKHIMVLEEKGFISERNNPKYKWDKTKQYRVNLLEVVKSLAEKGYSLDGYRTDFQFLISNAPFLENKNGNEENKKQTEETKNGTGENSTAIPEITTETTTKTTYKGVRKSASRFQPPTVEEVRTYCIERRNSVDADRFVDYYTANGWMVGKSKMKDWKAAVRTWERNRFNSRNNNAQNIAPDEPNILDAIM